MDPFLYEVLEKNVLILLFFQWMSHKRSLSSMHGLWDFHLKNNSIQHSKQRIWIHVLEGRGLLYTDITGNAVVYCVSVFCPSAWLCVSACPSVFLCVGLPVHLPVLCLLLPVCVCLSLSVCLHFCLCVCFCLSVGVMVSVFLGHEFPTFCLSVWCVHLCVRLCVRLCVYAHIYLRTVSKELYIFLCSETVLNCLCRFHTLTGAHTHTHNATITLVSLLPFSLTGQDF